jgi:hypothetical protein
VVAVALGVALLPSLAAAGTATLRVQARLREGPAATTELLGWVPAGTRVEIVGETNGWRQVETPDGKHGYIWGEHLVEGNAPDVAPVPPAPVAPSRAEGSHAPPATAADVERLRAEIERLTAAQRDLERRLAERPAAPPAAVPAAAAAPPAPPVDDVASGLVPIAFAIGGLLGFAASWLMQRRRDRRQWNRLRI